MNYKDYDEETRRVLEARDKRIAAGRKYDIQDAGKRFVQAARALHNAANGSTDALSRAEVAMCAMATAVIKLAAEGEAQ